MSIYTELRDAMQRVVDRKEVFTNIDVVNEAAASKGWSNPNFKEASKLATSLLSQEYQKGRLARYGPVKIHGQHDWCRRGGDEHTPGAVVYGGAIVGPGSWDTPNGKFSRLHHRNDPLRSRQGRFSIAYRDDMRPWDEQEIRVTKAKPEKAVTIDPKPLEKRIHELEAQLKAATKELEQVQQHGGGTPLGLQLTERGVEQLADVLLPRLEKRLQLDDVGLSGRVRRIVAESLMARL